MPTNCYLRSKYKLVFYIIGYQEMIILNITLNPWTDMHKLLVVYYLSEKRKNYKFYDFIPKIWSKPQFSIKRWRKY